MDRVTLRQKLSSRIEQFRLDEFDVDVYLRPLSALARARLGDRFTSLRDSSTAENSVIELQCRVVAEGLVTESGARIYQNDELQALAEEFPATALDRISGKILAMSGLGGSVSDVIKNSEPTPSDSSSSALPPGSDGGM